MTSGHLLSDIMSQPKICNAAMGHCQDKFQTNFSQARGDVALSSEMGIIPWHRAQKDRHANFDHTADTCGCQKSHPY